MVTQGIFDRSKAPLATKAHCLTAVIGTCTSMHSLRPYLDADFLQEGIRPMPPVKYASMYFQI